MEPSKVTTATPKYTVLKKTSTSSGSAKAEYLKYFYDTIDSPEDYYYRCVCVPECTDVNFLTFRELQAHMETVHTFTIGPYI